jgi:VanZ family protein
MVAALLPEPPTPLPFEAGDKVQHMLAFAVLSVLAAAFPRGRLLELFAAMALLGGLIEVLQMIPALHRDAEVLDWAADCAASLAALVIWFAARRLVARLRGASD